MADEEDGIIPANIDDPGDGPLLSWYCKHLKHEDCDAHGRIAFHFHGQTPGPHPVHCSCKCHKAQQSPKHQWYEWDDEIALEEALAEVPPDWLVKAASYKHYSAGKDAPWYYYGEWESRSATARYGRIVCKRCTPDVLSIAGTNTRVFCTEYTDPVTGRVARAGKCLVCNYRYWFWVNP